MENAITVIGHSHACPNGHRFLHLEGAAPENTRAAHTCPECHTLLPQIVYANAPEGRPGHVKGAPAGADVTGWEKLSVLYSDGREQLTPKMHGAKWRVYKLPGSGPWYLVDSGPATPVIYAQQIEGLTQGIGSAPGRLPHTWLIYEGQIAIGADGVLRFM